MSPRRPTSLNGHACWLPQETWMYIRAQEAGEEPRAVLISTNPAVICITTNCPGNKFGKLAQPFRSA